MSFTPIYYIWDLICILHIYSTHTGHQQYITHEVKRKRHHFIRVQDLHVKCIGVKARTHTHTHAPPLYSCKRLTCVQWWRLRLMMCCILYTMSCISHMYYTCVACETYVIYRASASASATVLISFVYYTWDLIWDLPRTGMSHVTRRNESCHT